MFCTNCGNRINQGDGFCSECGSIINVNNDSDTISERTSADIKDNKSKTMKVILFSLLIVAAVGLAIVMFILMKKNESTNIQKLLNLGNKYIDELDYEQAIVAFRKAIEIDSKCEEAYKALADIYVEMGDYDSALEILEMAVENVDNSKYFESLIVNVSADISKDELVDKYNSDIDIFDDTNTAIENEEDGVEDNIEDSATAAMLENGETLTVREISAGEYVELSGIIVKKDNNPFVILDNPILFHGDESSFEIDEVGLLGVNNSIVFEDIENKRVSVYGEAMERHTRYHFADVMIVDGYPSVKVIGKDANLSSALQVDDVRTNDEGLSDRISAMLNEVYYYWINEFDIENYDLYSMLQYIEYCVGSYEELNGEYYCVVEESLVEHILKNFGVNAPKTQIGDILYIDNKYYAPVIDVAEIGRKLIVIDRIFEKNGRYEVEYTIAYIYPENFETGKENPTEDWDVYYDFTLFQVIRDEFCEIDGTGTATIEINKNELYITKMKSYYNWD